MPDIKISEMTSASKFSGSISYVPMIESGTNKKVSATALFANIEDPVVVNALNEDNDTRIKGISDNALIFTDASTNRAGIGTDVPEQKLHVVGNVLINGVEYNKSNNSVAVSGALSLTTDKTIVDSSSATTMTLAAGTDGQFKTVIRKGSGSVVINPSATTILSANSITLDIAGSTVTLQYVTDRWYIMSTYRCTIA